MVKIREAHYSQLFSFGRFQNEEIGYTATLREGENPDLVEELRKKAILQHHMNQKSRDQGANLRLIERVERDCRDEVSSLRDKILQLRNRLRDQGYEVARLEHLEAERERAEQELKHIIERKENAQETSEV